MATIISTSNKLERLKKAQLVNLLAHVINLLEHKAPTPQTPYQQGWDDSRQTIIDILALHQYYED